ncbi:MAG: 8-amino-7-oxononanoate synthase [Candidatus Omnitrophota bacterium]
MKYAIPQNLCRKMREAKSPVGPEIVLEGRHLVNFSSNDYLGLSNHIKLKQAAKRAIDKYGAGSPASRLICGNNTLYGALEGKLARFKKTQAALVFTSGYTANLGIISALASRNAAVFSDKLNHASIVDAIILSRAEIIRYPHKNTALLEETLAKDKHNTRLIVTDTVFSMDGDIAPLAQIAGLAKKYNAMLMVDEAHATGVLGKTGAGCVEHFGLKNGVHLQMGTLSKAFGCLGGFVCASEEIIEYLINKARSLIYTTALPPSVLASNIAALEIIQTQAELRQKLWENVKYFKEGLLRYGFNTMQSATPIIPVLLKDNSLTMKFSGALRDEGIFAVGIRPPTVPPGEARIRLTVTAAHKKAHLDKALDAFAKIGKKYGVI